MMLYRFEVDYTVPGKMGNKNYVTAVAATDATHAKVESGKIFNREKGTQTDHLLSVLRAKAVDEYAGWNAD